MAHSAITASQIFRTSSGPFNVVFRVFRNGCSRKHNRVLCRQGRSGFALRVFGTHSVVVVESPAKAKKIQKYLGDNYKVLASYGHISDLPSKSGAVEPENEFQMHWQLRPDCKSHVSSIASAIKSANKLVLATDPDREGEAISWHILNELKRSKALKNQEVERITFTEVTKRAILEAMENPREISLPLIDAYLARRALDYLVGFNLSPLLWRKLPVARSAGRVQSCALRLLCERETEIDHFTPTEFWSIEAKLATMSGGALQAMLTHLNGKKLKKLDIENEGMAVEAVRKVQTAQLSVGKTTKKQTSRNPSPPFRTSTLQQEALNKLGFAVGKTMRMAQDLYEGGLITYMRTDGVQLASDAVDKIRDTVKNDFGDEYVPGKPRVYSTKSKTAQESHEAIRPTDPSLRPSHLPRSIQHDHRQLYDLIWKRSMSCQMSSAKISQISADIVGSENEVTLRSSASRVDFDGYQAVYRSASSSETSDDEENWKQEYGGALLSVKEGDPITANQVEPFQHFTKAPPRYTEATLVKQLEELGIGRPSTYAPTLKLLQTRQYLEKERRQLIPSTAGRVLSVFLEKFFSQYVDYSFTSNMEDQLDDICGGNASWQAVLDNFWKPFEAKVKEVSNVTVTSVIDAIDESLEEILFPKTEDGKDPRQCPVCTTGRLGLKPSRKTGGFIGCSNFSTTGCQYARPFGSSELPESATELLSNGGTLGTDPVSGRIVTLKLGRYGPFVSLDPSDTKMKPRYASVPETTPLESVDLEMALQLLKPLHEVGMHPVTGEEVLVKDGRYGPYLKCGKVNVSLGKSFNAEGFTMEMAVDLLEEKRRKLGNSLKKSVSKSRAKQTPPGIKNPRSAYILFVQERREAVKKENPELPGRDVIRELAARWKAAKKSEREKFEELAEKDKERFELEVAAFEKQQNEKVNGAKAAEAKTAQPKTRKKATTTKLKATDTKKSSTPKKGKKNPYMAFCQFYRQQVRNKYPDLSMPQVAKQLGDMWRSLTLEQREIFKNIPEDDPKTEPPIALDIPVWETQS